MKNLKRVYHQTKSAFLSSRFITRLFWIVFSFLFWIDLKLSRYGIHELYSHTRRYFDHYGDIDTLGNHQEDGFFTYSFSEESGSRYSIKFPFRVRISMIDYFGDPDVRFEREYYPVELRIRRYLNMKIDSSIGKIFMYIFDHRNYYPRLFKFAEKRYLLMLVKYCRHPF